MKKLGLMMLLLTAALTLTAGEIRAKEFEFRLKTDKKDAVYRTGETVRFSGNVYFNGKVPVGVSVLCRVYLDGLPQPKETMKFMLSSKDFEIPIRLSRPGWARLQVDVLNKEGKILQVLDARNRSIPARSGIGALADPEKITPGSPEPADFDAFWAAKRKELDQVPVNPVRTEVKLDPKDAGLVCYDVKLDCTGGLPVRGYLCMPRNARAASCPAIVCFHGAGFGSANKRTDWARSGVMVLDVNAHGLPNGMDGRFYQVQKNAPAYQGYLSRGLQDRNRIYFTGMFLRVMRALDYVKSLPEWDGKTLITHGSSQGGGQSLAAAALDPQVSCCIACVPALCDHGAPLAGRAPGWPRFLKTDKNGKLLPGQEQALRETAYVDCAFLAKRIKGECFISAGLIDDVCVPSSVLAACNNISGRKNISIMPETGHQYRNPRGFAWLNGFLSQQSRKTGK